MTIRFTVGNSDYRRLREEGAYFVDKSRLILEVLGDSSDVIVLPRPRRFGKTTNLSMLRYFLERSPEDLSHLFTGLEVWNHPEARAHFQKYPVLYITFKDVKGKTWEAMQRSLTLQVQEMLR